MSSPAIIKGGAPLLQSALVAAKVSDILAKNFETFTQINFDI